jgi:DNA primase
MSKMLTKVESCQMDLTDGPKGEELETHPVGGEQDGVSGSEESDVMQRTTLIIDYLTGDMEKDLQVIREKLAPLICEMEGALPEYFIDRIKKKAGLSKAALREEIKLAQRRMETQLPESRENPSKETDPAVLEMADNLKKDPLVFKRRIDAVNNLGVAGERKTIAMIMAVMDSCLLPKRSNGSEALGCKVTGPFGTGKSYGVSACLELFPKERFHLITGASSKSFYNIEGGLKHKVLILQEVGPLDTDAGGDNEAAYAVRSLLSEGSLSYQYTSFDDQGKKVAVRVTMDGPTALVTTTIKEKLERQLDDRVITIRTDTTSKQTKDILKITAELAAGNGNSFDPTEIDGWRLFHKDLEPVQVVIPFARKLAEHVTLNSDLPFSARRAFKRLISVIKTIALFHQHQRQRDEEGRIIAEMADYFLAYQLFDESFRENVGDGKQYVDNRIREIERKGQITMKELSGIEGVSVPTLTEWVGQRVAKGLLVWCDGEGNEFPDEASLNRAKHSGKAYIRLAYPCGLPTVFELTGDPRWEEGGELYARYDLGFGGGQDSAGGDGKTSAPALFDKTEQKNAPESFSTKEADTAAREFGVSGRAPEKNIQKIPAKELGADSNQLAEELMKEFSQCLAPGRLN